jgi:hypothetical protein
MNDALLMSRLDQLSGELLGIVQLQRTLQTLLYNWFQQEMYTLSMFALDISKDMKKYVDSIKEAIITTLSNYLGGITKELTVIDNRLSFINNSLHVIDEKITEMKTLFETFNSRLLYIIKTLDEFMSEFFRKMEVQLTEITNAIQNAYEVQNDFIQSQIAVVNNNIDSTQKIISEDIKTSANETISNIKVSTGLIQQSLVASTKSIIDNTNNATNQIMTKIDTELGDISNALDRFQSNMSNDMWKIYTDLKQFVTDIVYTVYGVQIVSYEPSQKIEEHVKSMIDSHPRPEVFT